MISQVFIFLLFQRNLQDSVVGQAIVGDRLGQNINGRLAAHMEFPWLVSVQRHRPMYHVGGGALVTPSFVLTSCMVVSKGNAGENQKPIRTTDIFILTAGTIHLSYNHPGPASQWTGQRRNSSIVHYHPGCMKKDGITAWELDFALLELPIPFKLNEYVQLTYLPTQKSQRLVQYAKSRSQCKVVGWGSASIPKSMPAWLPLSPLSYFYRKKLQLPSTEIMEVNVQLYSFKACEELLSRTYKKLKLSMNPDQHVCSLPTGDGLDSDIGTGILCDGEYHGHLASVPIDKFATSIRIYTDVWYSDEWMKSVVPEFNEVDKYKTKVPLVTPPATTIESSADSTPPPTPSRAKTAASASLLIQLLAIHGI